VIEDCIGPLHRVVAGFTCRREPGGHVVHRR
jgi:hypothetical protein